MKKSAMFLMAALICTCRPVHGFNLGDVRYSQEDSVQFCAVAAKLLQYSDEPARDLVIRVAEEFIDLPYVAGLLEQEPEMLTVDLRHSDCILFVEMCTAFTLTLKGGDCSFERFCEETLRLRYQNGVVNGYASRNHYTSAWILQGEANGIFNEVSGELGGVVRNQTFNFMSTHPALYRQLDGNPEAVEQIRNIEEYLGSFEYHYLPQSDIDALSEKVQTGDIICFVTKVDGLDIGHVALAYRQDGGLHFIHASQSAGKVTMSSETVAEYIKAHKSSCGLRVVRFR